MGDSVAIDNNKALAKTEPGKSALATASFGAPRTYEEAWQLATRIAASDLAPKDFKGKPENCLIAMQLGAELGLSPMSALQNVAVINGRPTLWGDSLLAVVMNHPAYESHEELTEGDGENRTAIFRIQRKGQKLHEVRFSVADAKRAKLWGKEGPWSQYPDRMLRMRARSWGLRDKFPDALRGMISAEEAQDYPGTTIVAEPVIDPADRALYDACDKLLIERGMNQAQREMRLAKEKGNLAAYFETLKAQNANGGTHANTDPRPRSDAADSVPGVESTGTGEQTEADATADPATADGKQAEPAGTGPVDESAAPAGTAKPAADKPVTKKGMLF